MMVDYVKGICKHFLVVLQHVNKAGNVEAKAKHLRYKANSCTF